MPSADTTTPQRYVSVCGREIRLGQRQAHEIFGRHQSRPSFAETLYAARCSFVVEEQRIAS